MKNNCDVSDTYPKCLGTKNCEHAEERNWTACDFVTAHGTACLNLAAIRAAIEAEHIVDANKMIARDCENCKHAEGPAMKGPCKNCVVMHNWEPAEAGEKGE